MDNIIIYIIILLLMILILIVILIQLQIIITLPIITITIIPDLLPFIQTPMASVSLLSCSYVWFVCIVMFAFIVAM